MVTRFPVTALVQGRRLAVLAAALGLALAGLAWTAASAPEEAVAFDQSWRPLSCSDSVRPTPPQRGLLDDAPGAGPGNDAAFVFVKADDANDERCTWYTNLDHTSLTQRTLLLRAAVNDGGRLWVRAWSGEACTGTLLAYVAIGLVSQQADGTFREMTRTLADGTVRSICLTLDDRSNAHAQRISALVDHIRLQSVTGNIGWQESFTRAG
jgi:hypothetical protein